MTYFDRFDIAEAHYLYARHYHASGDTVRRDFIRLNRIHFSPGLSLQNSDDPTVALTENGADIYAELVFRAEDDTTTPRLPCGHILGREWGGCCG